MNTRNECHDSGFTKPRVTPRRRIASLVWKAVGSALLVHVPECLLGYQPPDRGHPGSPPGDSREAVLRSNQGDRVAVDSCCRDRLGLPGLQLHSVTGVDKVLGVNVLEVIEASAATNWNRANPRMKASSTSCLLFPGASCAPGPVAPRQ